MKDMEVMKIVKYLLKVVRKTLTEKLASSF